MKSLAVINHEKVWSLEEFFNSITVPNTHLIQIKKSIIQLLNELVEHKMIHDRLEVILKSGKKRHHFIKNLTTSDISRRIKYIQFHEILQKNRVFYRSKYDVIQVYQGF